MILLFLSKIGIFQQKSLPLASVIPLSASFCGFVVLTNLSLKYNSVAFYQMMKVLTTPIVAFIQFFGYGIEMKGKVKVALGLTCIGVLGATMEEVTVSVLGSSVAFISVFVTAMYQVLVGAKQKSLEADSMQLLSYQAPISAIMLLICCPFFENIHQIMTFPYSSGLMITILSSSLLAALVNVSTFLIIGHTSAISYNVVGHCKLCLVLLFGFLAFDHQSLSLINLVGILIALCGIFSYSYIKLY
jgi:solute carrier family 35 protein E3